MTNLRETLQAARLVMAPMTKGSNLPYRRLAVELGARVLVSEMVVARRLKQRRRGEFALIRRAPDEPCFAVQLAGTNPDEMGWAAAVAEARGADFVDVNLGCPIDHFTRKGMGAALGRQPNRVAKIVRTMAAQVKVPVTVKIRLGWNAEQKNFLDVAKAAVEAGAAAITVHGRTREARYRHPADWDAIAEVAAAVSVPVVGNGDVLFPHELDAHLSSSGCVAAMSARGVLIKPWLFTELTRGYWDITAEERLAIYRRYVALAREHWGIDDYARVRLREFLRWHVGFWCRYAPRREDGSWPTMQMRESQFVPRSPLEALLARSDDPALDYVTDQLLDDGDLSQPPSVGRIEDEDVVEAGVIAAAVLAAMFALGRPQAAPVVPASGTATVAGVVLNAGTKAPLGGARVELVEVSASATTAADGRFSFPHLAAGRYTLTVSLIGFGFVRRTVDLGANQMMDLAVPVTEGAGAYQDQVTVRADETAPPEVGVASQTQIGAAELLALRGIAADDPMRAVQALPGVATGNDFNAEFSMRGFAFNQIGIVMDGTATPLLLHTLRGQGDSGSIAMINSDVLAGASLLDGPQPERDGDWLGATLSFPVREGSRDRTETRVAVSGTSASAVAEGPLGHAHRGSWLISARKSYIDWIVRKIDPSIDSTLGFADSQGKLTYDLTSHQQLELMFIGGAAALDSPNETSANGLHHATSHGGVIALTWRHTGNTAIYTSRLAFTDNVFTNTGAGAQVLGAGGTHEHIWRGDATWLLSPHWTAEAGLKAEWTHDQSTLQNFSLVRGVPILRLTDTGALESVVADGWGQLTWRGTNGGVSAGARTAHESLTHDTVTAPWLLAERRVGSITFRGGVGESHQFPDLDAQLSAASPLQTASARLVDAGIVQAIGKAWTWQMTGFARHDDHIIRVVDGDQVVNGKRLVATLFPEFASPVSGSTHGVDLVVSRRAQTGVNGWVAYTYAHTRDHDTTTGESFDGDFDQRHTLNVFLEERLSYRYSVNGKLRVGSNFPLSGYFQGTPTALFLGSTYNAVRLPVYARLDLRANRTFTFTKRRLTLFVEVLNALNRKNLGPLDGTINATTLAANGFTTGLIPRIPSAGFLFEF